MFKNKVVVITGDAQGIGLETRLAFEKMGAMVYGIDLTPGSYYQGDITNPEVLINFVQKITEQHKKIDILINNAAPTMVGIHQGSIEDFTKALNIGVIAPFHLVQLLLPYFAHGANIINLSSTRAFQSQPETESYAAAKGGITALTHSLAVSLGPSNIRVNAIAPGWIDTHNGDWSKEDMYQHPIQRIGVPADVTNMIMYLCSDTAGFITGQTFQIDGGMSIQMIYHQDHGWQYKK